MNWYKITKFDSVLYMYHGTGIQNLSSILSQGLNEEHGLLFDDPLKPNSIRSYGGIYLTNNIVTAASSGRKSSRKIEGRESGPVDAWVWVGIKVESRTPHFVSDEDQMLNPMTIFNNFSTYHINLAYYIANTLESELPSLVEKYLTFYKNFKKITDEQFLENLKPYVPDLIKTALLRKLAEEMSSYFQGSSGLYYQRQFEREFPQFAGLNEAEMEQKYRNAANLFMRKANRLTEYRESDWQTNMRSLEPISYKGKNKIIMVCKVIENGLDDSYYMEFRITYLTDTNILNKMISDATERFGKNIIVEYKGNVFYENPQVKEEKKEYELV